MAKAGAKKTPWRSILSIMTVVIAVASVALTVRHCMKPDQIDIGGDAMWELYVRGVQSKNENLVMSSLESLALVESRRAEAIQIARSKLRDGRPCVSAGAATALGAMGDTESAAKILAMLENEDYAVQAGACRALGLLGEKKAVERILGLIGTPDSGLRMAAVEALGRLGDATAVGPLEALRAAPLSGLEVVPSEVLTQAMTGTIEEALARLEGKGSPE